MADPHLPASVLDDLIRRNLPTGPLWESETAVGLGAYVTGLSVEFARAHNFVADLIDEASPCHTSQMLDEWMAVAGLPDPCWQEVPATDDEAKAALCAHVTARFGQQPSELEAHVLRTLGLVITIATNTRDTFRADISLAGDVLWDELQTWLFEVTYPAGLDGDALDRLKCFVNRFKPGHCIAVFVESEPWATESEPWATAHVAFDGAAYAKATGALSDVDVAGAVYTHVLIAADLASPATTFMLWASVRIYGNTVERDGAAVSVGVQSGGFAVAVESDHDAQMFIARLSSDGGAVTGDTDTPGEDWTDESDLYFAVESPGTPYERRYGGWSLVGHLVIDGAIPDALVALLSTGASPWGAFAVGLGLTADKILRAYCPALAYEGDAAGAPLVGGGHFWVPDIAQSRGGPLAPVNAEILAGNLSLIVMES